MIIVKHRKIHVIMLYHITNRSLVIFHELVLELLLMRVEAAYCRIKKIIYLKHVFWISNDVAVAGPEGVCSNPLLRQHYFLFMNNFQKIRINNKLSDTTNKSNPLCKFKPPIKKFLIRPCGWIILRFFMFLFETCLNNFQYALNLHYHIL